LIEGLGGDDAQAEAGQSEYGQEPVKLAAQDVGTADRGVERLLAEEDVVSAVAFVKVLLAFHPGGHTPVDVVGDPVEVHDLPKIAVAYAAVWRVPQTTAGW
jgi:hypothetical protein